MNSNSLFRLFFIGRKKLIIKWGKNRKENIRLYLIARRLRILRRRVMYLKQQQVMEETDVDLFALKREKKFKKKCKSFFFKTVRHNIDYHKNFFEKTKARVTYFDFIFQYRGVMRKEFKLFRFYLNAKFSAEIQYRTTRNNLFLVFLNPLNGETIAQGSTGKFSAPKRTTKRRRNFKGVEMLVRKLVPTVRNYPIYLQKLVTSCYIKARIPLLRQTKMIAWNCRFSGLKISHFVPFVFWGDNLRKKRAKRR